MTNKIIRKEMRKILSEKNKLNTMYGKLVAEAYKSGDTHASKLKLASVYGEMVRGNNHE